MKSIELTEEHKSKLLEMCDILFPEYIFYFHHHDEGKPDKNISYNFLPGFIFGFKKYEDGSTSENYHDVDIFIHWFEFCSIYMLEKLYRSTNDLHNFMDICFRYNFTQWDPIHIRIHPVDYLYKEFKKLNYEKKN
jgi:hypothetical protein